MALPVKKVKKQIVKKDELNPIVDVSFVDGLKAIQIQTRKFVQYDFDFTFPGCKIELPKIVEDDVKDAIVKVTIKINQDDAFKINAKEFEDYIRQYAYIVKPIIPVVQKIRRIRIKELNINLAPIDAVKVWLKDKKHKDIDEILIAADEIIREVGATDES